MSQRQVIWFSIVIIVFLSLQLATHATQSFPASSPGSPFNAAFMNPSNGFFPPGGNGFVFPPQQPLTGAHVAFSAGGPADQAMWAYYAMPASNPFYSERAAQAAMNRQRMMLMAQMRAQRAAMMSQTLANNWSCYQQSRASITEPVDTLFLGMTMMSANSMGANMCGGGTPGFSGYPAFGGGMSGMPSFGGAPYYSPQYAQLQLQSQAMELQKRQQDLYEKRFEQEQSLIKQNTMLQAMQAFPQALSSGFAAAAGGQTSMDVASSSRGVSTGATSIQGHSGKEAGHSH